MQTVICPQTEENKPSKSVTWSRITPSFTFSDGALARFAQKGEKSNDMNP